MTIPLHSALSASLGPLVHAQTRVRFFGISLRVLYSAIFLVLALSSLGQEDVFIYRFTVAQVSEPQLAKQVQHHLSLHPRVAGSVFIDETDVFKVTTTVPLSFPELQQWLAQGGFGLSGPVFGADGTILLPPQPTDTGP